MKKIYGTLAVSCLMSQSMSAFAMGAQNAKTPSNPATPISGNALTDIKAIAQGSSCKSYSWKNRGRAPAGYISGMAVSFAKSLCRQRAGESEAGVMARKNAQATSTDAIAWYEGTFDALKLPIDSSGPDTLRSLYTLGMGLGMRESSGKYCEGYDVAAGTNRPASAIEAGPFQTSYDSITASSELKKLYTEYKNNSAKCYLDVFSSGVSCTNRAILGTGEGAAFQRLAKSCPAFAAEYAMLSLRVLRKHYGPINRKEAEVNSSCNAMLDQVQSYVESRGSAVCSSL